MLHSLRIYLLLVVFAVSNSLQFALFSQAPEPTYQFLEASKAGNAFEAYQLSNLLPISFTSSYQTNGLQNRALPPQPIFVNSPTPKAAEITTTTAAPTTSKNPTTTTTTPEQIAGKQAGHVDKDHDHAEHHEIITPTTLNEEQKKQFAQRILHDLEDLSSRMCVLCFMGNNHAMLGCLSKPTNERVSIIRSKCQDMRKYLLI